MKQSWISKCSQWLSLFALLGMKVVRAIREMPHHPADINGAGSANSGGFVSAFFHSMSMILVSEIGDETFIIAALLAMRNPKYIVFMGAMAALAAMTVISAALGVLAPLLISRERVKSIATGLYIFFGLRLFWIAYYTEEDVKEEVEEVNQKLTQASKDSTLKRALSRFLTPIFLQSFVLTFLAEWGDRSQIATITLASHMNAVGVTIGAIIGHFFCTGAAVIGGQLLAVRISQRTVAVVGGCLFLAFALHNFLSDASRR